MNFKKKYTWACDHLKTSKLSADNFKIILDLDGSTPEPAIRSGDTGQRDPVLTAVNWSQHWCAICVQYQSSCSPKLARKCGIEHWFPNFLGSVDLLTHGAPQARFARQSSAISLVFFGPYCKLRILVFFHRFMVRARRAWAINRWKNNSVRNLQYGPKTRLIRGIYSDQMTTEARTQT